LSARQIAQSQISDPDTNEAFHFVTDRKKHPADLLINSLAQNNTQSRLPD